MEYAAFEIANFKGIDSLELDLRKVGGARVSALIGLNESGKTTVLEAINFFNKEKKRSAGPFHEIQTELAPSDLVPIAKKANFNGTIKIKATLSLSKDDIDFIDSLASEKQIEINRELLGAEFSVARQLHFKNSEYWKSENVWFIELFGKKKRSKHVVRLHSAHHDVWLEIVNELAERLPPILFFPTFLFDFPERIYLEQTPNESAANRHYRHLIQDVLDSMGEDLSTDTHIVDRLKPKPDQGLLGKVLDQLLVDKTRALQAVLRRVENRIAGVVFEKWSEVFNGSIPKKDIKVDAGVDDNLRAYVELSIGDGDALYLISERSLGFRWFFCFLLFTEFRTYRKGHQGVIFLFDEPASNLHARAQQQLLKTFGALASKGNRVVYSTHSHYMINPRWLEQAFIVRNLGLDYDADDGIGYDYTSRATKVELLQYRTFVGSHPEQTTYFRPALDALDYRPSALEPSARALLVEGKGDFYALLFGLGGNNPFAIFPGAGASGLDALISLCLGWGTRFIILLDDDKEGRKSRDRYISEWGLPASEVLTLGNIDPSLKGLRMEGMFSSTVANRILEAAFDGASLEQPTKKSLNRALQLIVAAEREVPLDVDTSTRFSVLSDAVKALLGGTESMESMGSDTTE